MTGPSLRTEGARIGQILETVPDKRLHKHAIGGNCRTNFLDKGEILQPFQRFCACLSWQHGRIPQSAII